MSKTAGIYKHKDHTITFDPERAHFVATIGGKVSTSSSLDAMKKKIEAAVSINFKQFKAFAPKEDKNSWTSSDAPLVAVVVTGIDKYADRWNTRFRFKIEGRASMPMHVYADTGEAVKAYEDLRKHNIEMKRVDEKMRKTRELLTVALGTHEIRAKDFTGKG